MIPKGLLAEIKRWMKEGLYGYLQVNFSNGIIKSVNRFQTVKPEDLVISIDMAKLAPSSIINLTGTESSAKTSLSS